MSRSLDQSLTEDDLRLIEQHHLGFVLGVYRLRSSYIRLYHWLGGSLVIVGSILVIMALILSFKVWQKNHFGSYFEVLFAFDRSPIWVGILVCFVSGVYIFFIVSLQARYDHITVCEEGLIQVKWQLLRSRVDVVRWEDIQNLSTKFGGWKNSIILRTGEEIQLNMYQRLRTLKTLIHVLTHIVAFHREQKSLSEER